LNHRRVRGFFYSKSVGIFSPTKEKVQKRREPLFGFGLFVVRDEIFFFLEEEDFLNRNITSVCNNKNQTTRKQLFFFAPPSAKSVLQPMIFGDFSTTRPNDGGFNYI
jgi:hypothetical protein